jgi:hypothetical protein
MPLSLKFRKKVSTQRDVIVKRAVVLRNIASAIKAVLPVQISDGCKNCDENLLKDKMMTASDIKRGVISTLLDES